MMYLFNGKSFKTQKLYFEEITRVKNLLEEKFGIVVTGFGPGMSIRNPDEPYDSTASIPDWLVAKIIREYVKPVVEKKLDYSYKNTWAQYESKDEEGIKSGRKSRPKKSKQKEST
jgi:hypothetical protein